MADHRHHHGRQGKAPISSSQAPGHSMVPKGSYSSYYPGTTAAYPTTQVVQTSSYKDYYKFEESKHKYWEHPVTVSASALTEKHKMKKHHQIETHVVEKHRIEKHVIEKHRIEKHVIEKHRIVSDPKLVHRHRIQEEVVVASGVHAVSERHEKKKAHKPKEVIVGKKHGHHLF